MSRRGPSTRAAHAGLPAPVQGAQTREILEAEGYAPDRIDALYESAVVK